MFYHNDFINNGVQVKINNPVANVWDDGAKKATTGATTLAQTATATEIGDTPYKVER